MASPTQTSAQPERAQSVKNAIASGQLEGLNPSLQLREGLRRYVAGEVSVEELLQQARLRHAAHG